jgi:hypothetical protein
MNNQKNDQCGAMIHHTACPRWLCPDKALACRVNNITAQGCPMTTPLSFVIPRVHIVITKNITALVQRVTPLNTNLVT